MEPVGTTPTNSMLPMTLPTRLTTLLASFLIHQSPQGQLLRCCFAHLQTARQMNLDYLTMRCSAEAKAQMCCMFGKLPKGDVMGKILAILFGQFSSVEAGRRAKVIRWHVAIDDCVQTGLISYLLKIKKRQAAKILPSNGDNKEADQLSSR